jgi:hypothetical protein
MSGHFRAYWELYNLVQVDELAFILQPISRRGLVVGVYRCPSNVFDSRT